MPPPKLLMHYSTMEYLKPTPAQLDTMDFFRRGFTSILESLEASVPEGRYRSLAITALEESCMWAMKAITRESDGTPRS